MQRLIIIGARGFGRQIFHHAKQCHGYNKNYSIAGFLDDKKDALPDTKVYPPILSSVENYEVQRDDIFICALGDSRQKKIYIDKILAKGGCFTSLIHPTAILDISIHTIKRGTIIRANAVVGCDVSIGEFVTIQPFAFIGHDSNIGAYCQINGHTFMGGFSKLGEGATLHTGAKLLSNKKIGEWAIIGAGGVVLHNIPAEVTAVGVPVRMIKK